MQLNKKILWSLLGVVLTTLIAPTSMAAPTKFYGAHLCDDPRYYCVRVNKSMKWKSMFPNEHDRDIVKRLNRTNIALRFRPWVVIPRNLKHTDVMDISPFPRKINTDGQQLVLADLKKQAFAAYNSHGYQVHWGPISAGKGWCPDVGRVCQTVIGKFKMTRKQGPECISSKFPLPNGGAEMPYCMHFYGGYAMHGADLPGYHASHGCIRMFTADAKWLNHNFIKVGRNGTKVVVVR